MNTTEEKKAVEKLIFSYIDAFNASDVSKSAAVYAKDGILMPQGIPLSKGEEQLKATFGFIFKTFKVKVELTIDEVIVNGEYAFARSHSNGETTPLAGGPTTFHDNKELFVLQKDNGQWKISHYIFNDNKM